VPGETVKIRVRVGANEVEIEAPSVAIRDAISLLPEMIQKIPAAVEPRASRPTTTEPGTEPPSGGPLAVAAAEANARAELPEIRVDKTDSLTDVITKIFRTRWGKVPRRLNDVRDVLESYGMIYPKQSVAVALLRLAQSGKLRRFKGQTGDFVYTASTVLALDRPSVQAAPAEVPEPPRPAPTPLPSG
jgi:hypothetical protein